MKSLRASLSLEPDASIFSPKNVPGLVLWLRADLGITTDGGVPTARVTHWVDQSGNGNNFAAGVTGPIYNASDASFGNKPTIGGGVASGDYLVGPTPAAIIGSATAAEIMIAIKSQNAGGNPWANGFGSAAATDYIEYIDSNIYFDGFYSARPNFLPGSLGPYVFGNTTSGAAWTAYLNGTSVHTDASGSFAASSSALTISGVNHGFPGETAEVLIYNNILSSGNRAKLVSYMRAFWSI